MLKTILNKFSNRFKVYQNYNVIARQIPFLKNIAEFKSTPKVAIVDFTSRRLERHYYFIIKFLSDSGYQVLLVNNKISIGCWVMFGKQLVAIPNLHLINDVPAMQASWLYFTDTDNNKNIAAGKRVQVRIDVANADKNDRQTVMMPLPMSVELYASGAHNNLDAYRKSNKVSRIVYSGNLDNSYGNESLKRIYHVNTRLELINEIKSKLGKDELVILNDVAQYNAMTGNSFVNKFILFDWFWNGGNSNLKGRIDNEEWLKILSRSDFFLGCPGIVMPPTHAVVEAMSVGCIPILQWPAFFVPMLHDNENCIVFKDLDDLIIKIRGVLHASPDQLEQLRCNVIGYYEQHLSPQAYIRKIEACKEINVQYFLYTDYSHLA